MQVTEHFSFAELTYSATGQKLGIKNVPNDFEMANIRKTAGKLEDIRAFLCKKYQKDVAIKVTSCFRCEALNNAVGGSKTSAHRFGSAADCNASGLTTTQFITDLIEMSKQGLLKFDQLILEFPERGAGSWVHIGFRHNSQQRGQILTAKKVNNKTKYLLGIHS